MLSTNGREPKQERQYHMSVAELGTLLRYLRDRYDMKFYIMVLLQFCLGLRASEMLAIQVWDFKDELRFLDYRQAKTNKMIYREPVPEPLRLLLYAYVTKNLHTMGDGYLFGRRHTTECYGAFWSKWRNGIGGSFKDRYTLPNGQLRYRISSHSLRRLHRTVLRHHINDLFIVKELCNYSDYSTLERYINKQEIIEKKAEYLLPILNDVSSKLTMFSHGQTQLKAY